MTKKGNSRLAGKSSSDLAVRKIDRFMGADRSNEVGSVEEESNDRCFCCRKRVCERCKKIRQGRLAWSPPLASSVNVIRSAAPSRTREDTYRNGKNREFSFLPVALMIPAFSITAAWFERIPASFSERCTAQTRDLETTIRI